MGRRSSTTSTTFLFRFTLAVACTAGAFDQVLGLDVLVHAAPPGRSPRAGAPGVSTPAGGAYSGGIKVSPAVRQTTALSYNSFTGKKRAPLFAAEDMQDVLARVSGSAPLPISVEEPANATTGEHRSTIWVALASDTNVPKAATDALAGRGPEAFSVHPDPRSGDLWLVGRGGLGCRHAIYAYLNRLGVRRYLPGDVWQVLPASHDIRVKEGWVDEPVFAARAYFGTGGLGAMKDIDPDDQLDLAWARWAFFNHLGGSVDLGGHAYHAFNVDPAVQPLLERDPTLRPCVLTADARTHAQPATADDVACRDDSGKPGFRFDVNPENKINYGHPTIQKLFVEHKLKALKDLLASKPLASTISVEPSDSGGHCECTLCRALGGVTDRVFTVANLTATRIGEELRRSPELAARYQGTRPIDRKTTAIYAYNQHLLPPKKLGMLAPGVLVTVVPFAFNETGLSGEDLVIEWGKHTDVLGVYLHLGIPDWARDQPGAAGDPMKLAEVFRFWADHNVRAAELETSYSSAADGLGLYLAAAMMWNPAVDARALVGDFYATLFGPAKDTIRELFEARWGTDYKPNGHYLGVGYESLAQAERLAKGAPAVLARVRALEAYLEYLRRYSELNRILTAPADASKSPEAALASADAATRKLMRVLWRLYPTALVSSYREAVLLRAAIVHQHKVLLPPEGGPERARAEKIFEDERPGAKPFSDAELAQLMADGRRAYRPFEEGTHRAKAQALRARAVPAPLLLADAAEIAPGGGGDPARAAPVRPEHLVAETRQLANTANNLVFAGTTDFELCVTPDVKTSSITFRVMLGERALSPEQATNPPPAHLELRERGGGKILERLEFKGTYNPTGKGLIVHRLSVKTPPPGCYDLRVNDAHLFFAMIPPPGVGVLRRGPLYSYLVGRDQAMYFQVPRGIRRVAFSATAEVKVFDAACVEAGHLPSQCTPVPVSPKDGYFFFEVPKGMDDKPWMVQVHGDNTHTLSFINVPDLFAYTPRALATSAALPPRI